MTSYTFQMRCQTCIQIRNINQCFTNSYSRTILATGHRLAFYDPNGKLWILKFMYVHYNSIESCRTTTANRTPPRQSCSYFQSWCRKHASQKWCLHFQCAYMFQHCTTLILQRWRTQSFMVVMKLLQACSRITTSTRHLEL